MCIIVFDVLYVLYNVWEGFEDEDVDVGEDMVSLMIIGVCLVDWMDFRKCYNFNVLLDLEKGKVFNGDVYFDFVGDILDKFYSNVNSKIFSYYIIGIVILIILCRGREEVCGFIIWKVVYFFWFFRG